VSIRVLFLEDDELFGETIKDFLEEEGFFVDISRDGEDALKKSFSAKYDLYIFDIKVPIIDGIKLLKDLREAEDYTPALYLTSAKDKEMLINGFEAGCDDYLKKPVDLDELKLRIDALIRRSIGEKNIEFKDFRFDLKRKILQKGKKEITLHPKEAQLLSLLLAKKGKIVTKEEIFEKMWSYTQEGSNGALRVYINSLKKILGKDSIENIRGVGYRFKKE